MKEDLENQPKWIDVEINSNASFANDKRLISSDETFSTYQRKKKRKNVITRLLERKRKKKAQIGHESQMWETALFNQNSQGILITPDKREYLNTTSQTSSGMVSSFPNSHPTQSRPSIQTSIKYSPVMPSLETHFIHHLLDPEMDSHIPICEDCEKGENAQYVEDDQDIVELRQTVYTPQHYKQYVPYYRNQYYRTTDWENATENIDELKEDLDKFFQQLFEFLPELEDRYQEPFITFNEHTLAKQFPNLIDDQFMENCHEDFVDDGFQIPLKITFGTQGYINIDDIDDIEQLYHYFHMKNIPPLPSRVNFLKNATSKRPHRTRAHLKHFRTQPRLIATIQKERETYSQNILKVVNSLCKQKEFRNAFELLEPYVHVDSKNPAILHQMGVVCDELRDFLHGYQYYKRAANLGCPSSMFELAGYYEDGVATPINRQKAMMYYHRAARRGEPNALVQLGVFYHAHSQHDNFQKAYDLYEASAMTGHCVGINNLGCLIRKSNIGDISKVILLFTRAAQLHYASGMFNLGAMIERGEGICQSECHALRCYEMAQRMKAHSLRIHSFNSSSVFEYDLYIQNVLSKLYRQSTLDAI